SEGLRSPGFGLFEGPGRADGRTDLPEDVATVIQRCQDVGDHALRRGRRRTHEHGQDGDGGPNQRLDDASAPVVRGGAAYREDEEGADGDLHGTLGAETQAPADQEACEDDDADAPAARAEEMADRQGGGYPQHDSDDPLEGPRERVVNGRLDDQD